MSTHTNLVCMGCGHLQPVQHEPLPTRCENCRDSFTTHGYFVCEETANAEEASQDAIDGKVTARVPEVAL